AAPALLGAGAVVVTLVVVTAVVVGSRSSPAPLVLPKAAPSASSTPSTATADATVAVHAAGALVRPGLYLLPGGSRVADVVAAAGGPGPEADLDQLNLATKVADGDRVHVPRRGEVAAGTAGPSSPAASGSPTSSPPVVDLNTATAEQLDDLPGIGPALAKAIVDHRTRHGRFRAVDGLLDVRGIGPAKLEGLRDLVRV
ncbi:MAG TPA: helix-hairpin-helix domain-containing protein, partial [Acidimicrobiales bacterium]|nr:helix-hairpin-helix domain-containing protein [Acidimicrobiales bacterium]